MAKRITRPKILVIFVVLNAIYWLPAYFFPDTSKATVNLALVILSLFTAMTFVPDLWHELWVERGEGVSWQSLTAKVGLFTLNFAFFLSRCWALLLSAFNYPDSLLHGPVGGFLSYMMGFGMMSVFVGFNLPGTDMPTITPKSALITAMIIGLIIGLALSRVPIPAS